MTDASAAHPGWQMHKFRFLDMLYTMVPLNQCRKCGSTAYHHVIARDERGAMRASGVYQCTGCHVLFTHLDEWRTSPDEQGLVDASAHFERRRVDRLTSRI
jgi:hypothetical protein